MELQKLGLVPFFTQQLSDVGLLPDRLGRVSAVQRSRFTVLCESAERLVELAPALLQARAVDRPTVGDWVVLDESLGRIEQLLERKTLFKRLGAGSSAAIQPLAANIDILFIVSSCNEEFKESRLERYLALCDEAGALPVIVLTKADLCDDADSFVRRARATQAGVAVERVNALDNRSLDRLRAWLDQTTTVALVGSSGVGKSTLLNTLSGRSVTATGAIREQDRKGRHTTSHRQLHLLPGGGLVIDVPGMRELRVAEIEQSIGAVFGDIEQLASHCQFADCQHDCEPGCAVLAAIVEGRLDSRRLESYRKLLRENALAATSLAEKRSRDRSFAKRVKEVKLLKQNKTEG